MKFTYLLIAFLFLALNGCSDFTSEANEFELSGKMYACDESVHGDIANDTKAGKKLYCNGLRWIDLVPEDSIVQNVSNTQIMYECQNGTIVKFKNLCSEQPSDYLPLDDTEYPYAGIPRIVIETEKHRAIKDRETEIPAKLQIWGESAPESEIMELTIRGRGNTSWTDMPKKSYKIEFIKKQEMLGMPKDKDWALISNYADKSLMRNYLMYNLSRKLGAFYAPRCEFADLFINGIYLGVYLLTETIKIGKFRVDIPKNNNSYIVEFDSKFRNDEQVVFSNVIYPNETGTPLRVHAPKSANGEELSVLTQHVENFEKFLLSINPNIENNVEFWIDENDFIKHFWIQELSKNTNPYFFTSVYFIWTTGGKIKMGPVWDFDLAFGAVPNEQKRMAEGWHLNTDYWYKYLFKDKTYAVDSYVFWINNAQHFHNILSTIDSLEKNLAKSASNNFKKWNILNKPNYMNPFNAYNSYVAETAYESYSDAVYDLKDWVKKRILWLDNETQSKVLRYNENKQQQMIIPARKNASPEWRKPQFAVRSFQNTLP